MRAKQTADKLLSKADRRNAMFLYLKIPSKERYVSFSLQSLTYFPVTLETKIKNLIRADMMKPSQRDRTGPTG
jgi:hypothetical protein